MSAGTAVRRDTASFRDPGGTVLVSEDRVYRTVAPAAARDYETVRRTGVLKELISEGRLIDENPVDREILGAAGTAASYVLEHPKLPFISYPYEWCFYALRDAALLQLDIHLRCLDHGVTLSDASAYNVQFVGPSPIFIDTLSFRPYREGEIWAGHRQFCEQFLNPLLLRSLLGIPHNAWYRGSMEGIPVLHLARALSLKSKFSWNVTKHVVLQAAFEKDATRRRPSSLLKEIRLPLAAFRKILIDLRNWIQSLEPKDEEGSVWRDYADNNSYASEAAGRKAEFVRDFVSATRPALLWDLGCNTGEYARTALRAGARLCIGFDFDVGALDQAYLRAKAENLDLLPLHLDATNPSPSQGWAQCERKGFGERASAGSILALALVHHLAISRNVPLEYVVDWLVGLAPSGVIEFIQKSDPMVQELLRFREDVFLNYSENEFERALMARSRIRRVQQLSSAGRKLFWFERD